MVLSMSVEQVSSPDITATIIKRNKVGWLGLLIIIIIMLTMTFKFMTWTLILLWTLAHSTSGAENNEIDGKSVSQCKVPCHEERFDKGRVCIDSGNKCPCLAHCCWAFDCRLWPMFANCRKKCRVAEWNKFGLSSGPVSCDHFDQAIRCEEKKAYFIDWDIRDVKDIERINCIQHCCYAFNCKQYSGYCRNMCNT